LALFRNPLIAFILPGMPSGTMS